VGTVFGGDDQSRRRVARYAVELLGGNSYPAPPVPGQVGAYLRSRPCRQERKVDADPGGLREVPPGSLQPRAAVGCSHCMFGVRQRRPQRELVDHPLRSSSHAVGHSSFHCRCPFSGRRVVSSRPPPRTDLDRRPSIPPGSLPEFQHAFGHVQRWWLLSPRPAAHLFGLR